MAWPSDEKDSKCIKVNDEPRQLCSEIIVLKKKLALAEEHRENLTPTWGTRKSGGVLMPYGYFAAQTP